MDSGGSSGMATRLHWKIHIGDLEGEVKTKATFFRCVRV